MAMLPVWKVVGFVLYVILYFNVLDAVDSLPAESLYSVVFKLLPMMHLIFVLVSSSTEDEPSARPASYRRYILLGLLASSVGDYLLIYPTAYFIPGALVFAVAHCFYIKAFGLRPVGSGPLAASVLVLGVSMYFFILHDLKQTDDKVMSVVYLGIIGVMAWRAAAQLSTGFSVENICAFTGALLFIISDAILVFILFKGSFKDAPFWNMVFYYSAQLFITLSASTNLSTDHLTKNK